MSSIFVPTLGMDMSLIERLANSVDYPINNKIVFNNGQESVFEKFRNDHPDWIVVDSNTGNKGVADSWNECAKILPAERWWFICNEDCWFLPGYLEKIVKCADENYDQPLLYLNSSNPFYAFVWTAVGRKVIGEFDPNFWPAYYEDADYRVRLKLKGYNGYVYILEGLPPLPHGKPTHGGTNYNAMIQGCGLLNRLYWFYKWGNQNFELANYQTPYNDQRLTVDQWAWYAEERATRKKIWDAWMSLPNPSIYE